MGPRKDAYLGRPSWPTDAGWINNGKVFSWRLLRGNIVTTLYT
jgi:hypothetical protein